MDGVSDGARGGVDPEGLLRSALEKIVFFECRVSQLEAEASASRTTAERARGDASAARRREVELAQALAVERGARADADARAAELADRVRLLETGRERLMGGLVDRARVAAAPASDGQPGPEEDGADLAQFIAELRAEIEELRARLPDDDAPPEPVRARPSAAPATVPAVAARFAAEGRVGLSVRDSDVLRRQLVTHADRALYERSLDDLGTPDPGRRLRAVRALEALGARAAAPLLGASLGREPEADVKAAILGALGRLGEPATADLAARALQDARPSVRVAALEALAAVSRGEAEGRLSASLRDPSPLVRRRAALLLGFAPGGRAEEALAGALADSDRGVARAAAAALSGRPTPGAQAALVRGLDHTDASVRRAAATALARLSGESVEVDGPVATRRAASRRIAEKLASMGADEIRSAVLDAAPAGIVQEAPLTPALSPLAGGEGARVLVQASRSQAIAEGEGARVLAQSSRPRNPHVSPVAAAARAAVAIAVADAPDPAALPADDLALSVLAEVRAALRGRTDEELAEALSAPASRIAAVTARLSAAGALVRRGPRWFTA